MGAMDCIGANISTIKWEIFAGFASMFFAYNAGTQVFSYPAIIAFCWFYADGKADVNLMVTFCRFFVTGEITPDTAIAKIIGQCSGTFAGAFFSKLMGNYGGTRRLAETSDLYIGDELSTELTTLMYEGIATGIFLLLFFAAMKMSSREASAVGYFIALVAMGDKFTINPARTITPMIVDLIDGKDLPTGFWAIWAGPVVGVPFFGLFQWVLTGQMPAMFKLCCPCCDKSSGGDEKV